MLFRSTAEMNESLRELSMMGYGLLFICHSDTRLKKDPHTNEDIPEIKPALDKRAYAILNRLVDLTCFIDVAFDADGVATRTVHTRETPSIFAGSRFRFLAPQFEFGYENLANELNKAIEMEGKLGATVVNSPDRADALVGRPFAEAMSEAEVLWKSLVVENESNIQKMVAIIEKVFGRPMKLSSLNENQQELLELVISEIKELKQ